MLPSFLLLSALALPSPQQRPPPPPPTPAPQPPSTEDFTIKSSRGVTLKYNIDMSPQDADAFLASLGATRELINTKLGIELPSDPIVQVRKRKGARKFFYTDGEDKVFFDFPNENMVVRLQFADERVLRYSIPAFLQLWLFDTLSSTAGLDPRVLQSLEEYARYLLKLEQASSTKGAALPPAPTGPGQAWYLLDSFSPGMTTFVLNALSSRKVPAHLLGATLREIALSATEDPKTAKLFDVLTPPEPILSATELVPGAPVVPTSPLKPGRLALFNGTPLLDVEGDPISPADRMIDFDYLFDFVAMTLPTANVRPEPPTVRGIDLWPLYFEFRPRILRARDNLDYYLVLREYLARFKDRAVGLRPTPALPVAPASPMWSSVFGLGFTRIGDRVYVSKVTAETAPAAAGIAPGLEVATIDGRPAAQVHDLLTAFTETFDSSPSLQRSAAFALNSLLCGAKDSECVLELRDPADAAAAPRTVRFTRGLPPPPAPVSLPVEYQMRSSDQVGVIRIRQFVAASVPRFVAAVDDLRKQGAKGLVIDVRNNEGMRDPNSPVPISLSLLGRLLPEKSGSLVVGSAVKRKAEKGFAEVESVEIIVPPAPGSANWCDPVAVLVDAWTGGEAEVFAVGVQLAKRGIVIGTTTAGNVTIPAAPDPSQALTRSRLELSFGINLLVRPNNEALQSVGVAPQIVVTPEVADLKSGRDTALERAIAEIKPRS
jgi:C-terminal processing protease CtpA/Prc